MNSAVLIGPSQDETTLLDEEEYRTLKCALEAHRSQKRTRSCLRCALTQETTVAG